MVAYNIQMGGRIDRSSSLKRNGDVVRTHCIEERCSLESTIRIEGLVDNIPAMRLVESDYLDVDIADHAKHSPLK